MSGIGLVSVPRLPLGAVLRRDEVRNADLLLLPERVVKLNGSSAAILRLCDGRRSVGEIVAALEDQFRASGLEGDVIEFLAEFREHGWVRA